MSDAVKRTENTQGESKLKKALYAFGMALMMGALVFSACSNPLTGKPETGEAQENRGLVVVQVGGQERTLQPVLTGFSRYELSFSGPSGSAHETETLTSGTSKTVELAQGQWTISAAAFTGSGESAKKAAQGSAAVTVAASGSTTAAITLSPYTGEDAAAGTFSYTVGYPAGLNSGTLVITKADGSAVDGGTVTLDVADTTASGTKNLAPGYYKLQIRLTQGTLVAGRTEALHIYPTLDTAAAYTFTAADFVAFAEVADVTVSGTAPYDDGGLAVNAEVKITLYNESFKDAIIDNDADDAAKVKAWFTNLPAGLSVAPKASVAAGEREITLTMSGTPANKDAVSSAALAITIPAGDLTGGKALTVRSNAEAKFAIGLPAASATVGNVTLGQEVGQVLTAKDVTITLQNARFTAIAQNASLKTWFTNLPAGLSAVAKNVTTAGAKTITASVSGTPTVAGEALLAISIPGTFLDRGEALTVTANAYAKFAITPQETGTVYLAGYVQTSSSSSGTNYPASGMFWKYRKNGQPVTDPTSLADGSNKVNYIGLAVDNAENVHLVAIISPPDTGNKTIVYQKNGVPTTLSSSIANVTTVLMALAPDGTVYIGESEAGSNKTKYYWIAEQGNTNPTKIALDGLRMLQGIAVDEQYIYLLGREDGTNSQLFLKYSRSTNEQVGSTVVYSTTLLPPGSVFLQGNFLHVAGNSSSKPYYAKIDTTSGALTEGPILYEANTSTCSAITVSGSGEVYLAGYYKKATGYGENVHDGSAVYWKLVNGALEVHELMPSSNYAAGTNTSIYDQGEAIAVDGTDVYVAGWMTARNGNNIDTSKRNPVYWKDTQGSGTIETKILDQVTSAGINTAAVGIVVR
jgi:hypothetical protein